MSLPSISALIVLAMFGYCIGIDTANSEPTLTTLALMGVLFVGPFIGIGWLAWRLWQPQTRQIWRELAQSVFAAALTLLCAFGIGWWRVHPSHIRYDFGYGHGASGTWHEVQFHHLEDGRWIKGPWVGEWPMCVRFPDLNHDGHADLEITSRGRVTFLYLPKHEGAKCWQLQENKGRYALHYPPAGLIRR
ncbi:MAG: hypothetical protein NTV80_10160 [Verrucomicrobia bacterium]|nr:hypothetical protein [Verrucomicrobiota bacterium]